MAACANVAYTPMRLYEAATLPFSQKIGDIPICCVYVRLPLFLDPIVDPCPNCDLLTPVATHHSDPWLL
jgi:hypothetical protein